MGKRGELTEEIKAKAKELLGIELTQIELRLMPYVQFVMMNDQRLDLRKINGEDRAILSLWRAKGWIEGGAGPMSISMLFWRAMCEILWLGYVNYSDE